MQFNTSTKHSNSSFKQFNYSICTKLQKPPHISAVTYYKLQVHTVFLHSFSELPKAQGECLIITFAKSKSHGIV